MKINNAKLLIKSSRLTCQCETETKNTSHLGGSPEPIQFPLMTKLKSVATKMSPSFRKCRNYEDVVIDDNVTTVSNDICRQSTVSNVCTYAVADLRGEGEGPYILRDV